MPCELHKKDENYSIPKRREIEMLEMYCIFNCYVAVTFVRTIVHAKNLVFHSSC